MIITTPSLTSFATQRNALVALLSSKIAGAKVTTVNSDIDGKYKADVGHVTDLLNAIEAKFKRCESLYYLYFENADHGVLSGNIATLPIEIDCTLHDGTATTEHKFKIDDRYVYKDIVDLNFQTFILTSASLYENLVLLAEIFLKKVIIYVRTPLSSPLLDYLDYLKLLISLGYRENDRLKVCVTSSEPYFDKYLPLINLLRNKFIHGFSINLETDGYNYYVSRLNQTQFTSMSPDLQLNFFTKEVLDQTRVFIINLLTSLKESGRHHRKTIPA